MKFVFNGNICNNITVNKQIIIIIIITTVWVKASILNLQDSLQYFDRSLQCCSLDGFHSSSYFRIPQTRHQSFDDYTKCTNYNRYYCHFHVP